MKKIVVAHGHTSIEIFHSVVPFILANSLKNNWKFNFVDYKIFNLFKQEGDLLILVRKYHDGKTTEEGMIAELKSLRKNFNKIVYFDDSAAASVILFSIFPCVDEYWKRSKLINTTIYKKKLYGGHLYSDYYSKKFGLNDGDQEFYNFVMGDHINLNKLKISWNIGIGAYPTNNNLITNNNYLFIRRMTTAMTLLPSIKPIHNILSNYLNRMKDELIKEVNLKEKIMKFSSRFIDAHYRKTVGYQRNLLIEDTKQHQLFLVGHKNKKDFIEETYQVFGTLSPFGWGEICYRDFEAALGGSLLIKPDMSHIETWPNLYAKDMYIPLSWDLSNLQDLEYLFDNIEKCEQAVNLARQEYLKSLNALIPRCTGMIENVLSKQ